MTEMRQRLVLSKDFLSRPGVAIPAAALMHGGLSAYGNALMRISLKRLMAAWFLSLLTALGAGAGALGARSITKRAGRYASVACAAREAIKQVLKENPELEHVRRALPSVTGFWSVVLVLELLECTCSFDRWQFEPCRCSVNVWSSTGLLRRRSASSIRRRSSAASCNA